MYFKAWREKKGIEKIKKKTIEIAKMWTIVAENEGSSYKYVTDINWFIHFKNKRESFMLFADRNFI